MIAERTSFVCRINCLSLAPGFSPVVIRQMSISRFNGFSAMPEAVETADETGNQTVTGLKPGANENTP